QRTRIHSGRVYPAAVGRNMERREPRQVSYELGDSQAEGRASTWQAPATQARLPRTAWFPVADGIGRRVGDVGEPMIPRRKQCFPRKSAFLAALGAFREA